MVPFKAEEVSLDCSYQLLRINESKGKAQSPPLVDQLGIATVEAKAICEPDSRCFQWLSVLLNLAVELELIQYPSPIGEDADRGAELGSWVAAFLQYNVVDSQTIEAMGQRQSGDRSADDDDFDICFAHCRVAVCDSIGISRRGNGNIILHDTS